MIKRKAVQISLTPRGLVTLKHILQVTNAASYSEVIRTALALYANSIGVKPEHIKDDESKELVT